MLLVFDVELETVGAVADVEVKDLVPDGVLGRDSPNS
jgi:hypothetical protein